jgi:endo-1,4-beta-xylanase
MKKQFNFKLAAIAYSALAILLIVTSCSNPTTLKEAYDEDFLVGSALNRWTYSEKDTISADLVKAHCSTISPENDMKWQIIHPEDGNYNFKPADTFVQFGEDNNQYILAHTLVWHSQTPKWVFYNSLGDTVSREVLLARMKDHIETIMKRYKGRVDAWDVVNEAIADDGSLRENIWYKIIGEDWIEKAFEYAKDIDPEADLLYNDYSLANPSKRAGAVKLIKSLQEKGLKVDGIGMQGHYQLETPAIEEVEASILAFSELGIGVHFTELDITVLPSPWKHLGASVELSAEIKDELNPFPETLPDSMQLKLADRYADLFGVFLKHNDKIERITFWGVTDRTSWLNNWPVHGRTNYPLLFDREGQTKPAFDVVMERAAE